MGSSIRMVAISMYSSMQAHLEAVDSFQHPVRIHQNNFPDCPEFSGLRSDEDAYHAQDPCDAHTSFATRTGLHGIHPAHDATKSVAAPFRAWTGTQPSSGRSSTTGAGLDGEASLGGVYNMYIHIFFLSLLISYSYICIYEVLVHINK